MGLGLSATHSVHAARPREGRFVLIFLASLVLFAPAYGWIALTLLESRQGQLEAWSAFRVTHLAISTMAGAVAVHRGSLTQRVTLAILALACCLYLYGFVWANTWGT